MPHNWRPSARSHTSGQSSRNFRRIPHRKTTANTSASNYDKSQPTLTANDQKTTFSDDRQHIAAWPHSESRNARSLPDPTLSIHQFRSTLHGPVGRSAESPVDWLHRAGSTRKLLLPEGDLWIIGF